MTEPTKPNIQEPRAERYNPHAIEGKWQEQWEKDGLYTFNEDAPGEKYYALTMFPYPSGNLHIGHWYANIAPDARARWLRMRGYNVLFPMGFDAFGLPAEQYAVQTGTHPRTTTEQNIERFIDWVHAHDLFQAPDFPSDLFALQDQAKGLTGQKHGIRTLPREFILHLHANRDVSLGGGYRAYPGISAAQIRKNNDMGW